MSNLTMSIAALVSLIFVALGIIRNDGVLEVGGAADWSTAQLEQVQGPGRAVNLISGIDTLIGGR